MITRLINSEEEYLELIADAIEFGIHAPNPFVEPERRDEDGLSSADSFSCIPAEELYCLLGVYLSDEPLPDTLLKEWEEDDMSWEEHASHFHKWKPEYRGKLKVFPDNPYVHVPKPEDYPIIIDWFWIDDWDRMGNIKQRTFQWWSLKELEKKPERTIRQTRELWESKFAAVLEEYAKRQEERYAKERESKNNIVE